MNWKSNFVRKGSAARALWTMLLGSLLSTSAFAGQYWVSCSSCSAQQASASASAAPQPPGAWGLHSDFVYVVDPINRSARKYEVTTILDPLFYNRSAQEISVENSVKASLESFWVRAEAFAKIDVPVENSPSAVAYLTNGYYSGRTRGWLDEGADGLVGMINAARFVTNVSAAQAMAALGADRGPLVLVLRFSDGSRLKVEVKMGQDAMTSAPTIVGVSVIPASAFDQGNNPLPTEAAGMGPYDVFNPSPSLLAALQALANAYNVPVTAGCGGVGTRWRCSANGTCELIHPC